MEWAGVVRWVGECGVGRFSEVGGGVWSGGCSEVDGKCGVGGVVRWVGECGVGRCSEVGGGVWSGQV